MTKTVIRYKETKVNCACNKCGSQSVVGNHRNVSGKIVEYGSGCTGVFMPVLKKRQGSAVKKYRKALKQHKIRFTEMMYITDCMCDHSITWPCGMCEMVVVFSW